MYSKENNAYTLDEIERDERLEEDCSRTEKAKQYIRNNFVKRFNELEKEFVANHNIETEEQYLITTEIFKFLKDKA